MIGKVLGNRYRVMREVGSGGMAQVYLAEDLNDNGLIAVKVLYPQFGEDISYVQRFKREAKLANNLTNLHIVKVLDYGADRDLYYLVMEYISGQDLRDYLDEHGALTWRDALETIDQVASALEHANEHGVVHRDIKPQNLMLDQSGLLKVLDFGIARVDTLPSLTQSGFVGSPYYVSPEQAMGEPVDIRSDIYSTGIVLYELLSGEIPFDAKSPWSVISKHISSQPPPIDFAEEDVPADVQSILIRMIAKKADDRFQTPSELRDSIALLLSGHSVTAAELTPDASAYQQMIADSFFERGQQAIAENKWGRATGLFSQVLKLAPSRTEAQEKLTQAQREVALISNYNIAKQALANGFWQDAVNRLEHVIELDPNYKDATELYNQARQKFDSHQLSQSIETIYTKAVALLEAEQWDKAIETFEEVQKLSPDYKQTERLLAQAKLHAAQQNRQDSIQMYAVVGLVAAALVVILGAAVYFVGGASEPPLSEGISQEQLKMLYQDAQKAIEGEQPAQAIALLQQISDEDPNYADVADLLRDLTTTPTPTSEPTVLPTPTIDSLGQTLEQAEISINAEQWSEAVDLLNQIRSEDETYQSTTVTSLLCDAYVGRGLNILDNLNPEDESRAAQVAIALLDFDTGAELCPRRTDLRDQESRAEAYIEALNSQALNKSADNYEQLIQLLTPIVAAAPEYANNDAKTMLYSAYIERGQRQSEVVLALSDFDAALALTVSDPSKAQALRARLLISGEVPAPPTITPTPEPTSETDVVNTPAPLPTFTPPPSLRPPPALITANESFFVGEFTEVILEWEPTELAADEYYDVTVTHIFGDELRYWGMASKESQIRVPVEAGAGEAGNDRFDWWVTIRQSGTAPGEGQLDRAVSERSEIRQFIWTVPQ